MNGPAYSIIVPAFDESQRLPRALEEIQEQITRSGWDAEVIVVSDGSQDDTCEIVRSYSRNFPVLRLIENPGHRGKGYSVRNGMLHANGAILMFADADLSTPISEAQKLFVAIRAGAALAIGSRWVDTRLQTRPQPLHRRLLGRVFNLLLRIVLGLKFKDTQCGFKAFSRPAAHTLFGLQKIEGWGFDAELLFLARKSGLVIREVAVEHRHRGGSKINPLKDGLRMVGDTFEIWVYNRKKQYPRPLPPARATPVLVEESEDLSRVA